jgi:hypothetical protein
MLNDLTISHAVKSAKVAYFMPYKGPGMFPPERKLRFKMRLGGEPSKSRLNHTVIPTKKDRIVYETPTYHKPKVYRKRKRAPRVNANSFTSGYEMTPMHHFPQHTSRPRNRINENIMLEFTPQKVIGPGEQTRKDSVGLRPMIPISSERTGSKFFHKY